MMIVDHFEFYSFSIIQDELENCPGRRMHPVAYISKYNMCASCNNLYPQLCAQVNVKTMENALELIPVIVLELVPLALPVKQVEKKHMNYILDCH